MTVRMSVVAILIALFVNVVEAAETNTPYPVGTRVSVTTKAGTVFGVLRQSGYADWIGIQEQPAQDATYIRAHDVIIRKLADDGPATRALATGRFERRAPVETLEAIGTAGHYILGRPRATDDRFRYKPAGHTEEVAGLTHHVRTAFTLGHNNRMKTPAWVAMRWTTEDLEQSEEVDLERGDFVVDEELPAYARTRKDLDFPTSRLERGHMARDADLEGWGFGAVREGMRMSNICPQREGRNHRVWGKLEDQHRFIVKHPQVSGIDTVWIVSGPFFDDDNGDGRVEESEVERVGDDDVAVPDGTYKLIAWGEVDGNMNLRAFMIRQNDTDVNLASYLVSVDRVEAETGFDFYHELDDSVEEIIEAEVASTLWGSD